MAMRAKHITIFGRDIIDHAAIEQLERCVGEDDIGVLNADAHHGYRHPIGGAVAYRDKISLSGVGFDIACGNKAVRTNVLARDVDIPRVMDEIVRRISFGVGRKSKEPVDHPVLERIAHAEFKPQRKLYTLAAEQLGTVGGGNHYVDLYRDDQGWLWVAVHFGSRGFGHRTTMGFIALAHGHSFEDHVPEGSMDAPPILFDASSELAHDYLSAIELAGEYAYAGRDVVVETVLRILGAQATYTVHNHHNFLWRERHFGTEWWVVRKGCTPAFTNQPSFIGSTMGDIAVIVEGIESERSRQALYTTVHGAGRTMSRTKAAGKRRWRKGRWVQITPGVVNFENVKAQLRTLGIELRGGGPDEAPQCYKPLREVLARHEGTIRILWTLYPLGVAMAGEHDFDPYKD
jgi:tRNA-splicing ligase RtcB